MRKEVFLIVVLILSIFVNAQDNVSEQSVKTLEQIKEDLSKTSEQVKELESRFTSTLKQEHPMPKALFVFYLLAINLILLLFVIVLLFYFYRKYIRKRYGIDEIHPVPKELVDFVYNAVKANKKLSSIRMELAEKGWEPSMIEHAIDAAKEKKI